MSRNPLPTQFQDPKFFSPVSSSPSNRAEKDRRNRIIAYVQWLKVEYRSWLEPDLAAYRDHLREHTKLSASSIRAHLSTIRGRYRELLDTDEIRKIVVMLPPVEMGSSEHEELLQNIGERIQQAIDPSVSKVEATQPRGTQFRLTRKQASELLRRPGLYDLQGIRDTAMIGLILCTGLRAAEICALTVSNLDVVHGATHCLFVTRGLGSTERLVPHGMYEILNLVQMWLQQSGIKEGYVFRSFYKGAKRVRDTKLRQRAVELIVESHPIIVDANRVSVTPMVLRRTYANLLFRHGIPLQTIADYLGVSTTAATEYVGSRKIGSDVDPHPFPEEPLYNFDLPIDDDSSIPF